MNVSKSAALALCFAWAGAGALPAAAQGDGGVVPRGWHIGHVHIKSRHAAAIADERALTITKPPAVPQPDDRDVFFEGGTPYNDIRAFNPEPRIDSGVQFPYGLDGIGGYGSDLGFSAGQDAANYDRGS